MYSVVVGTALAAVGTVGVASAVPAHNAATASTAHDAAPVAGAHRVTTTGAKAVSIAGAHRVILSVGDPAGAVRPWELTAAQRASAVG
ncbi:hypothetical protein SAMN05216489_00130 [Streptomyces sp. 3213]|nr:hypothetical protein SAMN05216489_00130 [Streptomyces sp. 3213] [Streptomyces sp. 3213.3]